jgi:hypothetical protein
LSFGGNTSLPWLILGDFNSISHPQNRCNGSEVFNYETKEKWIASANVLEAHSLDASILGQMGQCGLGLTGCLSMQFS